MLRENGYLTNLRNPKKFLKKANVKVRQLEATSAASI